MADPKLEDPAVDQSPHTEEDPPRDDSAQQEPDSSEQEQAEPESPESESSEHSDAEVTENDPTDSGEAPHEVEAPDEEAPSEDAVPEVAAEESAAEEESVTDDDPEPESQENDCETAEENVEQTSLIDPANETLANLSTEPPTQSRLQELEERICRLEDALALKRPENRASATTQNREAIQTRPALPVVSHSKPPKTGEAGEAESKRKRPWLVIEIYNEVRAIIRMYVDPRHRMSWHARFLPIVLLALLLSSSLWLPGIPLLKSVLDLILGYFLFKVLIRESTRYRQTSPDLPASLRL